MHLLGLLSLNSGILFSLTLFDGLSNHLLFLIESFLGLLSLLRTLLHGSLHEFLLLLLLQLLGNLHDLLQFFSLRLSLSWSHLSGLVGGARSGHWGTLGHYWGTNLGLSFSGGGSSGWSLSGSWGIVFLLELLEEFDGLLVEFLVAFDHEFFECEEIVDGHDLVDNLLVDGVLLGTFARLEELFVGDTKFLHQLLKEIFNDFFEILFDKCKRNKDKSEVLMGTQKA